MEIEIMRIDRGQMKGQMFPFVIYIDIVVTKKRTKVHRCSNL